MGCGGSTPTTTEEKPIHVAPPSSRPHPEPVKLASPAPVSNPVPVPHQPPLGLAPPLPPALATEPQPDLKLVQNPPSEEVPRGKPRFWFENIKTLILRCKCRFRNCCARLSLCELVTTVLILCWDVMVIITNVAKSVRNTTMMHCSVASVH